MAACEDPSSRLDPVQPLAASLAHLAGTPDDTPGIRAQLTTIAQLAADRIAAVSYASITMLHGDKYVTVAATSELAREIDAIQYTAREEPCVHALEHEMPAAVPNLTATMHWPAFETAARRYGLCATMSAPLYAGSGACIAVLNLFGRDLTTMAPIIHNLWAIYHPNRAVPGLPQHPPPLDAGARELLAGLTQALATRQVIQHAVQLVRAREGCAGHDAYLYLLQRAAVTGRSLAHIAAECLVYEAPDGL